MFKPAHELVQEAKKSVRECPATEIHSKLAAPGTLLIDVREPDEHRQGHIAGSVNIPRGMLEFKISNEPSLQNVTRPVIVYCKTSGRAALAACALHDMGYLNVRSIAGGFDAWAAAGKPVAAPSTPTFG